MRYSSVATDNKLKVSLAQLVETVIVNSREKGNNDVESRTFTNKERTLDSRRAATR